MSRRVTTKAPSPPVSAAKTAASRWHVDLRTAQRWLARRGQHTPPPGALESDDAMVGWVASLPSAIQAKLAPRFRARITALRIARERAHGPHAASHASAPPPTGAPAAFGVDPDYAAFQAARLAAPDVAAHDQSHIAALKHQRAFALYKLERAHSRNDPGAVKDATESIRHFSSVIFDEETLAQRLGREVGDILPRPEAERLARALAYWLLRSTDDLLADVCPRLAAASSSGPLFREEVRQIIEPAALSHRVLAPFARAAQLNAGHTLPAWLIATLREAMASTLEDGAALFAALYETPLIKPPSPSPSSPPILPVTEALRGPPPSAPLVPLVTSVPSPNPEPPGAATASHSNAGSVSAQTAGEENK